MASWQKTTRSKTQCFKLIHIGPGARNSGPTKNTGNNCPRTQDPNAMNVNATTSFPFKKLSNEEHKQYMKEGRCFICCQQGHMARECTHPLSKPQTQARATDTKKVETEEAPPYTPEASSSRVATTITEDKVQTSVAAAQANIFAILGNKIVRNLKLFVEVDYLRS